MTIVNIYEAKAHLSDLVHRAEAGEEVVIARNGVPAARLVPVAAVPIRSPGGWEGQVWRAPDFDASDEVVAALMRGEDGTP